MTTSGIGRRSAAGQEAQRERSRRRHLQKQYGLTLEEVDALRQAQQGLCACCGKKDYLVVDHDHKTGRVREMLCTRCNTQLHVLEDAERMATLLAYLSRHQDTA